MNIRLNIEAGNPMELQEAITGLAGIMGGSVAPQPESEKTKRSNKAATKPEKQSDPDPVVESNDTAKEASEDKPDPVVESDTAAEDAPDTVTETEEIPTVVELRAKAQEKGTTPEGKKAIKALLDKFESKSISDVPEDKRAVFLRELDKLGKSEEQ